MKRLFTFAVSSLACIGLANAQIVNKVLRVGDTVHVEGKVWYVGANLVTNPSFSQDPAKNDNNIVGWTNGKYAQMTTSTFTWNAEGGYDGGAWLQYKKHTGAAGDGSIGQRWSLDPESKYYFTFWIKGLKGENQYVPVVSLTANESTAGGQNEKGELGRTIIGKNGEDTSGQSYGFANYNEDGSWARTSLYFDSEEYTYLQFNARWLGQGDYGFDGFYLSKLLDPETTSAVELKQTAISGTIEEIYPLTEQLDEVGATLASESIIEYVDNLDVSEIEDETELDALIDSLNSIKESITSIVEAVKSHTAAVTQAKAYKAQYPGYPEESELDAAIQAAEEFAAEGYAATLDEIVAANNKLQAATKSYLMSQPVSADAPADYTFLVQNANLTKPEAAPTILYKENNEGIESVTYPNADSYEEGKAPADFQGTGWNIADADGDHRGNWKGGRICWNDWRTKNVDINRYQDLTDLPNGYYTVSAEMITQPSWVNGQHVYANSTTQNASSPELQEGLWDEGTWTYLTTSKVLVTDGKLRIGAYGKTANEGNQKGWFCVTNFRLLYYGITDADVAQILADKISETQDTVAKVYFKGDKAALTDSINAVSGVSGIENSYRAIETLNRVITTANASIKKYNDVMVGSLNDLKNNIAESYKDSQITVAQATVDAMTAFMNADNATYTEMDSLTALLRNFRDNYLPTLGTAQGLSIADATAKAALDATIAGEVKTFTEAPSVAPAETINAATEELNNAIAVVKAADAYAKGGENIDLSDIIINAGIANSDNGKAPTGWTVNKGNGNTYTANGQAYDGDSNNRYLDSWNGTAGNLQYTAQQTLKNIPNGVYELKAKMRTSGEGAYLFAATGEAATDTVIAPAHVQKTDYWYIDQTATKGDSLFTSTDAYGPIWAEAFDYLEIPGNEGDEQANNIVNANGGKGRGWFYNTLRVEVTNNVLTVGVTTDSIITLPRTDTEGNAGIKFAGTWFSADDFTLTLVQNKQAGDFNIASGVKGIENDDNTAAVEGVYTIDGRQVRSINAAPKGVYIIKSNGKTTKVFKK